MGMGIHYECTNCDFTFELNYSGAARGNSAIAISECESGKHGELARFLLSEDCPICVNVGLAPSIYYCEDCKRFEERWSAHLSTDDEYKIVLCEKRYLIECPHCDNYMEGPFSGDEAKEFIEEHQMGACPKCKKEASLRWNEYEWS